MAILELKHETSILNNEQSIVNELDKLFEISYQEYWRGSKRWTYKIKEALSNLGHSLNYISSSSYDGREWLFDLIWFTTSQNDFNELILAMESEWFMAWHHIKYDFEKLLITNATHKLMICQSTLLGRDTLLQNFQKSINKYQLGIKRERFLISIYNTTDETEFWHYLMTRD